MSTGGVEFSLVIDNHALNEVLRGPSGPVVVDMMKRATVLQEAAKQQVRMGHVHAGGGYGNLRDSIVKRIMMTTEGRTLVELIVGSSHPISLIHHEGTKPHTIVPVNARALRFPGYDGIVYAAIVHHPGTAPNRYLTDNLHLVVDEPGGGG